jgi:hypothetical protein
VPGDQGIEDVSIHQFARSDELGWLNIWAVASEISKALIQDGFCPSGAE